MGADDGDRGEVLSGQARALGFSIDDIGNLLSLWQNKSRSSASVKKIAGKHVEELKRKIAELKAMADTLVHLTEHCHGDHRPDCPILDDLSDPTPATRP